MYVCIYICVYKGGCRKRGLSPALRALCYIPLVAATCYIPPVADVRFSNKPCLKVANLMPCCQNPYEVKHLYRCRWSRWLAEATLMQNIGGDV